MKLTKFEDPGHGWLAVPVSLLSKIGLNLNDFSVYSYRSNAGSTVYLEEDCDASKLVQALKEKGIRFEIEFQHSNSDSFIRSLPGIHC